MLVFLMSKNMLCGLFNDILLFCHMNDEFCLKGGESLPRGHLWHHFTYSRGAQRVARVCSEKSCRFATMTSVFALPSRLAHLTDQQ